MLVFCLLIAQTIAFTSYRKMKKQVPNGLAYLAFSINFILFLPMLVIGLSLVMTIPTLSIKNVMGLLSFFYYVAFAGMYAFCFSMSFLYAFTGFGRFDVQEEE